MPQIRPVYDWDYVVDEIRQRIEPTLFAEDAKWVALTEFER